MNRMFLSFIIIQFAFIAGTVSATTLQTLTVVPTGLTVGIKPSKMVFTIKPSNNDAAVLAAASTITIYADKSIFIASVTNVAVSVITSGTDCVATATTSANGQVLTVTLAEYIGETCEVPKDADFVFEITAATAFAVNPAAGAVSVTGVTSGDTTVKTGTGYTTVAGFVTCG